MAKNVTRSIWMWLRMKPKLINVRAGFCRTFFVLILVSLPILCPDALLSADFSYRFSPALLSLDYEEPGVMEESGTLVGVKLKASYGTRQMFGEFSGEVYNGELEYDGALFDGTPVSGPTRDSIYRTEMILGTKGFEGQMEMRPYLGFGWRQWRNDLRDARGGYRRKITYWYFPLGIILRPSNENFELRFQRNIWKTGRTVSYLNDQLGCGGSPPGLPVRHNQNSGQGNNFLMTYFFENGYTLDFSYRSWKVDRSNVQPVDMDCDGIRESNLVEPANQFRAYSLGLGVQF